jgi:cytochrome c-type biogenesis protein CcmF
MLAAWVLLAGVRDIFDKTRHKGLIKGLRTLTRSYWGMQIAHLGIAVCALGVVLSSQNSAERDLRLAPGESMELAGYQFVFEGAKHFEGRTSPPTKAPCVCCATARKSACCTRKNACTPYRAR